MTKTEGINRAAVDERYLGRIAALSFEDRQWTRESIHEIRDLLGPWNHNIKLPFGVHTAWVEDFYPAHREIMTVINHTLGGDFRGKRILDVGCLEAYFAAECALQGADVLGIDGKTINIKKCEFVKSVLDVRNLAFAQDDAMNVTREKYGVFDVVLALGLLYHLASPFKFMAHMADICRDFILIDTHTALIDQPVSIKDGWRPSLSPLQEFRVGHRTYVGRLFREFEPETSQLAKNLSPTASLENDMSVWLTEDSLVALLRDVGFDQISKLMFANDGGTWWSNPQADARVLFLAVKNRRPFQSRIFAAQ